MLAGKLALRLGLPLVHLDVEYPDRPLNRLTTFFRPLLSIPILIIFFLATYRKPQLVPTKKQWLAESIYGFVRIVFDLLGDLYTMPIDGGTVAGKVIPSK